MSKQFYQLCTVVLIILLLVVSYFAFISPISNSINKIHGAYKADASNGQNIITLDEEKMEFYRFVDSELVEKGVFRKSKIENIFFLTSDINDTYIILNNNNFYFVDESNSQEIYYFEKISEALMFLGEIR